jgi:DNA-binding transcriptional regulator YdaS (Cro superfamily)
LKIEDILARLLHEVALLIANGHLTERRLARLTGISQPHIHHILNGKRRITPQDAASRERTVRIPLLQGFLGPDDVEPDMQQVSMSFPFPVSLVGGEKRCVAVRAGRDELLRGTVEEGDVAILALNSPREAARQGNVYAFRGSWVLDIPAIDLPERRGVLAQLRARKELLAREGRHVARVLWILRGIEQFVPPAWDAQE